MRSDRFYGEITERVADQFELINGVDFRLLVTESAEALLELAEPAIEHSRKGGFVFILESLPELPLPRFELRSHSSRLGCLLLVLRRCPAYEQQQHCNCNQRPFHVFLLGQTAATLSPDARESQTPCPLQERVRVWTKAPEATLRQ